MTEYKVYKMINDDMPGLVYYGSTKQTLKIRLNQHRYDLVKQLYKSCKLFEIGEPKIIQLDVFDNELDMYKKEREYIENNECLNVALPCIKKKDYSKGKIYKIVNVDFPELVYYGSTIVNLKQRFSGHKNNTCTSKKLFETENVRIELVEDYPCETKRELETREKYYILNFNCINRCIPIRTKEELQQYHIKNREKNKEKIKTRMKQYRQDTREHIYEYNKKYNEEHKEEKKIYRKKYKEINKESIKQKNKIYNQNHKEECKQRSYEWRGKNPEKFKEAYKKGNEKRKERAKEGKLICECGSAVVYYNLQRHERSKKHKNYLDTL
tara:strand:- start:180 stop:1154 length:975 start_codon:yes stop_codon:yes gene_type:complete